MSLLNPPAQTSTTASKTPINHDHPTVTEYARHRSPRATILWLADFHTHIQCNRAVFSGALYKAYLDSIVNRYITVERENIRVAASHGLVGVTLPCGLEGVLARYSIVLGGTMNRGMVTRITERVCVARGLGYCFLHDTVFVVAVRDSMKLLFRYKMRPIAGDPPAESAVYGM
jgi:hypothetical protein